MWAALAAALVTSQVSLHPAVPAVHSDVLVDTRCDAQEWAGASRTPVSRDIELLLQQDTATVYLCVPLPADSYGTMDVYIQPASGAAPTNLHVSAQVGERQRTASGWPAWTFGNHRGWYSPPVAVSGSSVVDGRARLEFGSVAGREIAIRKDKFGTGDWRLMFELRALGPDKQGSATFPTGASSDDVRTWATITPAAPRPADGHDVVTLQSAALGESRELWLTAPDACKTTSCDLLLVLDAHALFPLASGYTRVMHAMGRMPPVIVVGVPSLSPADRIRNFTASVAADERARYPQAGGAPRFLRFLVDEALPAVAAAGYTAPRRRILAGHSLAGLFVVGALVADAGFDAFVAISPTLGWHREEMLTRLIAQFESREVRVRQLGVTVANDAPPYRAAFDRLAAAVDAQRPPWLDVSLHRLDDEDHVSTVAPALYLLLKRLLVTPPPPSQ